MTDGCVLLDGLDWAGLRVSVARCFVATVLRAGASAMDSDLPSKIGMEYSVLSIGIRKDLLQ